MTVVLRVLAAAIVGIALTGGALMGGGAAARAEQLSVELNKFETIENGCRTFFLFRNQTQHSFDAFELSLAVLNRDGVIDRLLTVEAAPLPAERTTLKLFEIPETACENIGEILLHEIASCEAGEGGPEDCFDLIELNSRADAPLVK